MYDKWKRSIDFSYGNNIRIVKKNSIPVENFWGYECHGMYYILNYMCAKICNNVLICNNLLQIGTQLHYIIRLLWVPICNNLLQIGK